MVTARKTIGYLLTEKDVERVYYELNKRNLTPSKYAILKGVPRTCFLRVLKRKGSMTKKMYIRAFKDLNCFPNLPEELKNL